jgi:hypothetical protein
MSPRSFVKKPCGDINVCKLPLGRLLHFSKAVGEQMIQLIR